MQHPLIRPLIEEAAEALVNGEGSEFLASYLEKIKEIKEGLTLQDETYEAFKQSYESNYDFNVNVNRFFIHLFLGLEIYERDSIVRLYESEEAPSIADPAIDCTVDTSSAITSHSQRGLCPPTVHVELRNKWETKDSAQ